MSAPSASPKSHLGHGAAEVFWRFGWGALSRHGPPPVHAVRGVFGLPRVGHGRGSQGRCPERREVPGAAAGGAAAVAR